MESGVSGEKCGVVFSGTFHTFCILRVPPLRTAKEWIQVAQGGNPWARLWGGHDDGGDEEEEDFLQLFKV